MTRDASLIAAEERLDRFLRQLQRLGAEDYERLSIPDAATQARALARSVALRTAADRGLDAIVADGLRRSRDVVLEAFVGDQYQPTWFGLNWGRSTGRVSDRAAVVEAVTDASIAAAMEGVIDQGLIDQLKASFDTVASLRPDGSPGSAAPTHRWRALIAWALIGSFVLGLAVVAAEFGFLAAAIPIGMMVGIVVMAGRAAAGHE